MPSGRKPLRHLSGPITAWGDAELRPVLERAFDAVGQVDADALTHGFHVYPARMHPGIARTVVRELAKPRSVVLDPFCGSGTVILEAMLAGHTAIGVDLNPIALRVAEVRVFRRDSTARKRLAARAAAVVEASKNRVRAKADARAPLSPAERRHYQPHVLKELAGLWDEISAVHPEADRRALEMVFSSILVKFSRQRADTSSDTSDKRIGRFIPSEFFEKKAYELVERLERLEAECPPKTTRPRLLEGDARDLAGVCKGEPPAALVVTSPPYGGTYDYVDHHARRYPWFGLSPARMQRGEIGARRNLSGRQQGAVQRWDDELSAVLESLRRVCEPGAPCVMLMGDGWVGGRRVPADEQLRRLAPDHGFELVAGARQPRPDWQGGPPRAEHLIALRTRAAD